MNMENEELSDSDLASVHADRIAALVDEKWIYHRALKHVCELYGENLLSILEHFATPTSERQQLAQQPSVDVLDAKRLDWLIKNEYQVWEMNERYAIHNVTEHNPITSEFNTAREAIDKAMNEAKPIEKDVK